MKRIVCNGIGLVLSLGLLGLSASAQNQAQSSSEPSSSLGDYARQVRKGPAANSKKVYDNDNLPRDEKLSVIGSARDSAPADSTSTEAKPAESSAAAPAGGEAKPAEGKAPDTKASTEVKAQPSVAATAQEDQAAKDVANKQWSEKIAAQKDQIDLLERELNVLQREYQIRAAAMYGDVGNRMRNSGDWDKQDSQYKQQIADKQKALDDAKQKLEDLQESARKAGVPASAREP